TSCLTAEARPEPVLRLSDFVLRGRTPPLAFSLLFLEDWARLSARSRRSAAHPHRRDRAPVPLRHPPSSGRLGCAVGALAHGVPRGVWSGRWLAASPRSPWRSSCSL